MKDIKRKLEQLTYEIKLVKSDDPDRMIGVMIRLEELTDLVNKLLIPDITTSTKRRIIPNVSIEETELLIEV
jgi:hypothetical protein